MSNAYKTIFQIEREKIEDVREIEKVEEFFNFEEYQIVYTKREHRTRHKDRDRIDIELEYNNLEEGFTLYGDKVGMFKKAFKERYKVLLKGDMFILHNLDTGLLTTYNALDWTILKERVQCGVNLRMEAERLTTEYLNKQFLY